jgi:hypothetical protein
MHAASRETKKVGRVYWLILVWCSSSLFLGGEAAFASLSHDMGTCFFDVIVVLTNGATGCDDDIVVAASST